jgi:hypothetical protein
VRITRRVPADRDMDVAALAPEMLTSQFDRLLASLPEADSTSAIAVTPASARRAASWSADSP